MPIIINFVLFQVAWFACVLGAAQGMPWAGPAVVAAVVAFHLAKAPLPGREIPLLVFAAVVGAIFDSLLVSAGWLVYPSGQLFAGTAPYWIVAMWVAFATTLNVTLHWLKGRIALAALFGAIGGPAAFYAGAALGGVVFADPVAGYLALAVGWALLMPLLMAVATRFDGWRPGVGRRPLAVAEAG